MKKEWQPCYPRHHLHLIDDAIKAEFKTPKPTAGFPLKRSTKMVRKAWLVEHLKRRSLRNLNLRIITTSIMIVIDWPTSSILTKVMIPDSMQALNQYLLNQSSTLFSALDTPDELIDALWKHQSLLKTPQSLAFQADQSEVQVITNELTK